MLQNLSSTKVAGKAKLLRPFTSVRSTRRAGEGGVSGSSEMHGHAESLWLLLFGIRTESPLDSLRSLGVTARKVLPETP
jgi:hypothetical protein